MTFGGQEEPSYPMNKEVYYDEGLEVMWRYTLWGVLDLPRW